MNLNLKRTLLGSVIIVASVAAVITFGVMFGWWTLYLMLWGVIGIGVLIWVGGMLLMLAHSIGKSFFPDPPKKEDDQLDLFYD